MENIRGIAPGVNLINLKVADKDGMTYESDVIEAFEWVYNHKSEYNIRVVNLSMNSSVAQSYHTSPLDAAVEILWFNGIVVVVSAGNNGTGDGPVTLYPPANDPFVITVGATEDKGTSSLGDDNLAVFSAYGTTEDGFAKPDLVAPGRNLIAPLADKATTVYTEHPLHRVGDYYFRMSGTSMSAPVVSGAVALLLQDEPNLNPDQVKYRLMATANQNWLVLRCCASRCRLPGCVRRSHWHNGWIRQPGHHAQPDARQWRRWHRLRQRGLELGRLEFSGLELRWLELGRLEYVGWNTVGWNSVGWNTVGWNTCRLEFHSPGMNYE